MNTPLLSIENLSVNFISEGVITRAVENADIKVERGEIVAIVGESGSGKSVTSLSILKLLPQPPAQYPNGKILFQQHNRQVDLLSLSDQQMREIRGNQIAMIFQEPMTSLNPVFTCGNQVMEAIMLHQKITDRQAKQKTFDLFEQVKLPNPAALFDRYPHQLSGGQKQRVMIAMAISSNPLLLICDEPTTALDVTVQKTILELIKDLQRQHDMGVIFITHDLNVVAGIADKVVVMYKGKIVEQGASRDIFTKPEHAYTRALLACRPSLHPKGERLPVVEDFLRIDNNDHQVDHPLPNADLKTKTGSVSGMPAIEAGDSVLIKVEHLKVWYPAKKPFFGKPSSFTKAVDDVSFKIIKGETLGLVGESGCGKTTLGRAILNLVKPTDGRVIFDNKNLVEATPAEWKTLRRKMQIIFQDPYSSLNPRLTIGAAISEPLMVHNLVLSKKERKEKVIDMLEKVSLKPEHYYRYPHEFSGGQRQRIVIARALILNPAFIICDESVSALDVSVQAQVLNLLNDLKKEFGFTAIFISHDLSVVRYISDRIMVMNKGRIVETGEADAIYQNPSSPYTLQLIASIPKGKVT